RAMRQIQCHDRADTEFLTRALIKIKPLRHTNVTAPSYGRNIRLLENLNDMLSHYEESLQRDIKSIRKRILQMAGLAERALKSSLQALVERNRQLAYGVILRDHYIDELEKEVDRLCLEFLVRQQP